MKEEMDEQMDPEKAYYREMLYLPKKQLHKAAVPLIKRSLTMETKDGKFVVGYKETDDHLAVPRHYLASMGSSVSSVLRDGVSAADFRSRGRGYTYPMYGGVELTYTQIMARQALHTAGGGILHLACGKGKTYTALAYLATLKTHALVVVHNNTLVDQWLEQIERFFGEGVGAALRPVKGCEKTEVLAITVTTVQTLLSTRTEAWRVKHKDTFGLVVYDECHHYAAPAFNRILGFFTSRYRLGLTATPARADGTEKLYQYHLGSVVYTDTEHPLTPRAYLHEVTHTKAYGATYQEIISEVIEDEKRNMEIVTKAVERAEHGKDVLILSPRVSHVEWIGSWLRAHYAKQPKDKRKNIGVLHGGIKGFDRTGCLQLSNIIVATNTIAAEGLDVPRMSCLIVTVPVRARGMTRQMAGRVSRTDSKTPNKHAEIHVMADKGIPLLYRHAKIMMKELT